MESIHLTIKDKKFYVSKDVLLKFDFFRGLFEVQENDLVLDDDICPDTFKIILDMQQGNNILLNVAMLCDKLGLNQKNPQLQEYTCHEENCSKLSLNEKFCVIHKCSHLLCSNLKKDNLLYCDKHTCNEKKCHNFI